MFKMPTERYIKTLEEDKLRYFKSGLEVNIIKIFY